jgi:hypothetical protein
LIREEEAIKQRSGMAWRDRRADRRILLKAGDVGMEVELAPRRTLGVLDTLRRRQHDVR